MNKRIKKLWKAALKSGEYRQTQHGLKNNNKYCCLGVLCELHSQETGGKWDDNTYLDRGGYLPAIVKKWAGLYSINPVAGQTNLAKMNDSGKSFIKIANMINRYL